MRNPFARLVRHDDANPTLRQRVAALKASAARIMRREPVTADADQGRRTVMVGSLAVAAAMPLPVLAFQAMAAPALAPILPHPDQALFDAEVEDSRTRAALDAAEKAASEGCPSLEQATVRE